MEKEMKEEYKKLRYISQMYKDMCRDFVELYDKYMKRLKNIGIDDPYYPGHFQDGDIGRDIENGVGLQDIMYNIRKEETLIGNKKFDIDEKLNDIYHSHLDDVQEKYMIKDFYDGCRCCIVDVIHKDSGYEKNIIIIDRDKDEALRNENPQDSDVLWREVFEQLYRMDYWREDEGE